MILKILLIEKRPPGDAIASPDERLCSKNILTGFEAKVNYRIATRSNTSCGQHENGLNYM
jgi:hypothetical protein